MQGQGWGRARPNVPQATSPANTPVSALPNHGMSALNTSGALPAVLFADSVYSLRLNQLPNPCAGTVQT